MPRQFLLQRSWQMPTARSANSSSPFSRSMAARNRTSVATLILPQAGANRMRNLMPDQRLNCTQQALSAEPLRKHPAQHERHDRKTREGGDEQRPYQNRKAAILKQQKTDDQIDQRPQHIQRRGRHSAPGRFGERSRKFRARNAAYDMRHEIRQECTTEKAEHILIPCHAALPSRDE